MSQGEPERVLVFMGAADRNGDLGRLVSAMLQRDHAVTVALEPESGAGTTFNGSTLNALSDRYRAFDHIRLRRRTDLWHVPAGATRRGLDYLRYLEFQPADADESHDMARAHAPRLVRALLVLPPFRWRPGRRMLSWVMERLEAAMPLPGALKSLIRDRKPDVIVVSSHAELGSFEFEFVRVACATRTPSVLVLTPDGPTDAHRIRDLPTVAVVADQQRANEARQTYGLPRERIQAVGSEGSNGTRGPASAATVEVIEGAATTEKVDPPPGRVLRPILWLSTPLLLLLLLLIHPRTTSREIVKAVRRQRRDAHRRRIATRKSRARQRAGSRKASAQSARAQKRAQADAASQRKAARAQEKRTQSHTASQEKAARAEAKRHKREQRGAAKQHRRAQRREGKTAATDAGEDPEAEA